MAVRVMHIAFFLVGPLALVAPRGLVPLCALVGLAIAYPQIRRRARWTSPCTACCAACMRPQGSTRTC